MIRLVTVLISSLMVIASPAVATHKLLIERVEPDYEAERFLVHGRFLEGREEVHQ